LGVEEKGEAPMMFTTKKKLFEQGDQVAVSFAVPKTSALCYERVFSFDFSAPHSIRAYEEMQIPDLYGRRLEVAPGMGDPLVRDGYARLFSEKLKAAENGNFVPVYESKEKMNKEFKNGNNEVVVYVLENLEIVDENKLSWSQVVDFRGDKDSRKAYRRMLHWMEKEMQGKTFNFIQDEVEIILSDYQIALKKHGIKTILGEIEGVFSKEILIPQAIIGATGVVAGKPMLSASICGVLTLGKVVATVAKRLYDIRMETNIIANEIAFVHEAGKLN
jgi:hypothetical protein